MDVSKDMEVINGLALEEESVSGDFRDSFFIAFLKKNRLLKTRGYNG